MGTLPATQERSFPGPISVRWTWVDWVYCLFVIPVAVFLLLWWGVTDWLEHFWIFAVPAFAVLMLFLWVVAGIAFRFLRCYWPQPRPMPWWHGPLWATLPLLIVAWIWIERHDDRPGLWLDRQMWAQGLFFQFETSLTGDGEDVHIRRLIECVGYGPGLGQALGFERPLYLGIKQYATPQSVGQRLAAGGAVMLVVQDVCDDLVRWASDTPGAREGTIAYPLPDDDLPLIAWTPTPDDPEMIEAYVTRSYYQRPDARVQFRDLAIRLATPNSEARKEDEFAWFYPASDEYPPEKYRRASYFGLYVIPISQAEWSESEEIARLLRSIDRPSIVAWGESERRLRQSDRIPKPFTPWGTTSGVPSRQLLRPEILGAKGQEIEYRERAVPLRWDGKAFVMSPADRGAVVLYRKPAWASPDGAPLRVRFRDVVLVKERPYGPRGPRLGLTHLFAPIEGILYGFGAVYVHTKP